MFYRDMRVKILGPKGVKRTDLLLSQGHLVTRSYDFYQGKWVSFFYCNIHFKLVLWKGIDYFEGFNIYTITGAGNIQEKSKESYSTRKARKHSKIKTNSPVHNDDYLSRGNWKSLQWPNLGQFEQGIK